MALPGKKPISVPTREELYNLSFMFFALAGLSLICWAGFEIVNRVLFASALPHEEKIRPALLLAFVFLLGMALAFYNKARTTVFTSPEREEEPVWIDPEVRKQQLIDEAFRKLERPGQSNPQQPPPSDGQ